MDILVFDYTGDPRCVLHGVTSIQFGGCSDIIQFHMRDGSVREFTGDYSFQF